MRPVSLPHQRRLRGRAGRERLRLQRSRRRARRLPPDRGGRPLLGATVNENLEVALLGEEALEHFVRQTQAHAGVLFVNRDSEWVAVASSGLSHREGLAESAPSVQAFREDRTVKIDVPEDLAIDAAAVSFRPRAVLLVPVSFKSTPLALVVLASANEFGPDSERLIDLLRRTFGVALRNAISHEQMERLAAVDSLTGPYNRRFGLARLREEFARARREVSPLGLLIFDVDHFKSINDTFGHLVGDRVLEQVANASRAVIREGDVLIRYGGDEFVAILPLASAPDVAAVGERIRLAVGAISVGNDIRPVHVTVSVGAAVYPDLGGSDPDDLLRSADDALYEAKSGDRNRFVLATA